MPTDHMTGAAETAQIHHWKGSFGTQWSTRNLLNPADLDAGYQHKYGVSRSALNQRFLGGLSRSARILEVGCNTGNQLLALAEMGFTDLHGIEIQEEVVKQASERLPFAKVTEGSAFQIPYADASCDLVFTSGVLIHIAPHDLPRAMIEIHRVSNSWIWGLEYFAPEVTEIPYRGETNLMWKADYAKMFLQNCADLELAMEERLSYLEDANVDTMFLLHKKK